jgi:hypothetical protein
LKWDEEGSMSIQVFRNASLETLDERGQHRSLEDHSDVFSVSMRKVDETRYGVATNTLYNGREVGPEAGLCESELIVLSCRTDTATPLQGSTVTKTGGATMGTDSKTSSYCIDACVTTIACGYIYDSPIT